MLDVSEKQFEPLDREEQQRLLCEYQKHKSEQIRDLLIQKNLRLVMKIVRHSSGVSDIQDAFQEGVIGLITAIEKFDPKKDAVFSTYATYWIKAEVHNYLYNTKIIKLDRYLHNAITVIRASVRKNAQVSERLSDKEYQTLIEDKIVKKNIKILRKNKPQKSGRIDFRAMSDKEVIDFAIRYNEEHNSLDRLVNTEEENGTPFSNFIPDERRSFEEDVSEKTLVEYLFSHLNKREKKILTLLYGLDRGGQPRTLKEVGNILGRTGSMIQQQQKQIIEKLKSLVQSS